MTSTLTKNLQLFLSGLPMRRIFTTLLVKAEDKASPQTWTNNQNLNRDFKRTRYFHSQSLSGHPPDLNQTYGHQEQTLLSRTRVVQAALSKDTALGHSLLSPHLSSLDSSFGHFQKPLSTTQCMNLTIKIMIKSSKTYSQCQVSLKTI